MNSVVVYRRGDAIGGGGVDDILARLGNVETDVSELRAEVRVISAVIPYLATKADLKAEIGEVKAEFGSVRTEIADVRTEVAKLETKVTSVETAIIKWIIATVLTTAGLAFSIAKFVH